MNPDIADFIATGKMITVWADADAPDRVNDVVQVDGALLSCNYRLAIFTPIQSTSFEVIIRSGLLLSFVQLRFAGFSELARDKYHLAHIFAICVLGETLVNFLIFL